ncbi:signal recognition particle 14 kDa protein [Neocloeon triangulifer]|uniref:signal recognition particle 14 kDa protein n=1 Tax=Neocloeon triangulifer TaxID=2078957 RepID=UPI00286F2D61|nr:signal recognition particle 14 kDa protein [Neocloeon triangulifer]
MVLLDHEAFFAELQRLFFSARATGTVRMTIKRYDGRTKPEPREGKEPLPAPVENMCLVRATCRSKKISTVVHGQDVKKFHQVYASLMRGSMDALKKQKKPKTKSKAAH